MNKTLRLVNAALFAALTCVATMCIHIPTPGTGGYIHPGDGLVILSGILLGPVYGSLAAAIGSALADALFGYYIYVPATFVIKGAMALVSYVLFHIFTRKDSRNTFAAIIAGVFAALIMAFGYLGYESILYGTAAIASLPANLIQGFGGMIFATLLLPVASRVIKMQSAEASGREM